MRRRWVALLCAAGAGAVATLGGPWTTAAYAVFLAAASVAGAVDHFEQRIPNVITYPLMVAGIVVLPWLSKSLTGWSFAAPVLGGLGAGGWALLTALVADQGAGDVKLSAAIGVWLGHFGPLVCLLGVALGQLATFVVLAANRRRPSLLASRIRDKGAEDNRVALGPALVCGAVTAVLAAGLL